MISILYIIFELCNRNSEVHSAQFPFYWPFFPKLMLEPVAKVVKKKYQTRSRKRSRRQKYSLRSFEYNPYYSNLDADFDVEYCIDQLCSYLRRRNHISLTVVRNFRTHLEFDRWFSDKNKNPIPDLPLQLQRLLLEVSSKPKLSDSNQVSSDSNPKLSDSKAESSDPNPESNDSNPEVSKSNQESSASNPISSDSNPESSETKPESSDPNSESNYSNPELSNSNRESSTSNPISSDSHPELRDSKLESNNPNSESNNSNTELSHSNVKSSASNPISSDSNPELSDSKPESSNSNPESNNSNQESSRSSIGGSLDSREQPAASDTDVTDEAEGSAKSSSCAALTSTRDSNSSPPAKKPKKEKANISGALKDIFVQYFERLWRCLYIQNESRSSVYKTVVEKKFSLQSYIMEAGRHIQSQEESWFRAPPTSSTQCSPEKSSFKAPQPLRLNNRTVSSAH